MMTLLCISSFFNILIDVQGTPVNIIVGSHVWVEDTELAWIDGQVAKITGQEAEIESSNGKKVHFLLLNCESTFSSELFLVLDHSLFYSNEIPIHFLLLKDCCQIIENISKRYGSSSWWS